MAISYTKLPIPNTEKGVPGGVATLDPITGYIPLSQIDPSIGGQGDVLSVNNIDPDQNGNVDITTSNIPEGENQYYTQERFDSAFDIASEPINSEITAIEEGSGLNIDGSYIIPVTSNYLGDSTSIHMATTLLDSVLKASYDALNAEMQARIEDVNFEEARAVGAEQALGARIDQEILDRDFAIGVETARATMAEDGLGARIDQEILDRQGQDGVIQGLIESETQNRIDADGLLQGSIDTIQGEIDDIEAGVGLDADGLYIQTNGANYTDPATTVVGAVSLLDVGLKAVSDGVDGVSTRVSSLENDHVGNLQFQELDGRIDSLESGLPVEIQARIDDIADLQGQLDSEIQARIDDVSSLDGRLDVLEVNGLYSNTLYANDGVTDIQTQIDAIGASQGRVIFVTSGSFSGSTLTFTDKTNLSVIAPKAGTTICELANGRGMTIDGSSERVRVASIQIEGTLNITGCKGRHIFSDCDIQGGVNIDATTDSTPTFIVFQDCEFSSQNITISNLTNCTVYFNRCAFNNKRVVTTNVASPLLILLSDCSGLNSLQTNLTSGVVLVGRTSYNDGTVKVFSTTSDYVNLGTGVITTFSGSYNQLSDKPTLVTSANQLSDYNTLLLSSMKGVANGVAELDANGLVPNHHLPPLALTKPYVVNTIADRDALTGIEMGDVAIVVNDSSPSNNGNYIYDSDGPSWIKLYSPTAPVDSVNGQTGTVTLYSGDIQEGQGANSEPSQLFFTTQRAIDAVITSDINTDNLSPSTQTVKGYVTGITDALDTRLTSVENDALTHATISYVDNAISGLESLGGVRTAVGLDGSDQWSLPASNYLGGQTVITGALSVLDSEIYSTNGVNSSQNTALGLASNGTKTNFSSTHYVTGNSSFKAAIEALDAGLNTVAGNVPTINSLSDISNVNVSENLGDNGKFLKWDNSTSKWIADNVPAGYNDEQARNAVGSALANGVHNGISFVNDDAGNKINATVSLGINSLTDVDTQTTPPLNFEALVWDSEASLWKPQSIASSMDIINLNSNGGVQDLAKGKYYQYSVAPLATATLRVPTYANSTVGTSIYIKVRNATNVYLYGSSSDATSIIYIDNAPVGAASSTQLLAVGEYKLVCTGKTGGFALYELSASSAIGLASSDNLPEGLDNLYYSDALVADYIDTVKGQVNGIASLDGDGKLPVSQLPASVTTIYADKQLYYMGEVMPLVNSQYWKVLDSIYLLECHFELQNPPTGTGTTTVKLIKNNDLNSVLYSGIFSAGDLLKSSTLNVPLSQNDKVSLVVDSVTDGFHGSDLVVSIRYSKSDE